MTLRSPAHPARRASSRRTIADVSSAAGCPARLPARASAISANSPTDSGTPNIIQRKKDSSVR